MCQLCNIDTNRAEAFSEGLIQTFNNASMGVMISLGHRTRLFDFLHKKKPLTSKEIATGASLYERYVREWLAAMVTGKIIEYNPETQTYFLPPEHGSFLTREAGYENFATLFQYIAVMGSVEDKILACFKNGGGVPYESFKRFHEVMADDSGQNHTANLISKVLPIVNGLMEKLENGIHVLDIGCGQGRAINILAKIFPKSNFTGIDLCNEPIEKAKNDAKYLKLNNTNFIQMDATSLKFSQKFGFIITFDAVHDQAHPDKVLKNIANNLSDGGTYLMVDIDASSNLEDNLNHPLAPALYSISTTHCMTVSLAQGGMGLGTMWGIQKAETMLKEAGFKHIAQKRIESDIQNVYFICNK